MESASRWRPCSTPGTSSLLLLSTREVSRGERPWHGGRERPLTHVSLQIFRSSWAVWCICATASRTPRTAACWRPTSGPRSVTSSPGMPVPYWAFLSSLRSALGEQPPPPHVLSHCPCVGAVTRVSLQLCLRVYGVACSDEH